jgi:hypothetical protein
LRPPISDKFSGLYKDATTLEEKVKFILGQEDVSKDTLEALNEQVILILLCLVVFFTLSSPKISNRRIEK